MRRFLFVVLMIVCAGVAFAVEPDEVLSDPTLEARARDISKELRCLVCRNEHIDASDAAIAKDLRLLVRERLLAGDSDAEVIAYIVDRYGEFVLLRPPLNRGNILLYLAGPFALLIGFGFWLSMGRKEVQPQIKLSKAEEKRLKDLLDE